MNNKSTQTEEAKPTHLVKWRGRRTGWSQGLGRWSSAKFTGIESANDHAEKLKKFWKEVVVGPIEDEQVKPDMTQTLKTLTNATATYRAAYVKRAIEMYMNNLIFMRAELAAAGWDLEKVAPYPKSNIGRQAYHIAIAKRSRFTKYFSSVKCSRSVRDPDIVVENPDAVAMVESDARMDANACFDSYIYKLAGKITEKDASPVIEAIMTGVIWDGCSLVVNMKNGTTQKWNTKCIINQSVYGKLFNQWPTRLVV